MTTHGHPSRKFISQWVDLPKGTVITVIDAAEEDSEPVRVILDKDQCVKIEEDFSGSISDPACPCQVCGDNP